MRKKSASFDDPQCGAALLTILLMVTVMAALSVAVIDDIRFAIRRTANVNLNSQAHWYAMGAETFARQIITGTPPEALTRALASEDGTGSSATFDIDGGWIKAVVSDGTNCFNLNSVVADSERGQYKLRPLGATQYGSLLIALEFTDSERDELSAALVDWIDSDTRPQPRGAEDYDYSDGPTPYRTGNTLLADVSELRTIEGYTVDVMARLRPFVCALPVTDLTVLNINSLKSTQAALLSMLVGTDLSFYEAQGLIDARPGGGFATVEAFWQLERLAGLSIDQGVRNQVSLKTDYYALDAQVSFHEAFISLRSLFKKDGDRLTLLSRQFGNAI